jgi:hypothetical protein
MNYNPQLLKKPLSGSDEEESVARLQVEVTKDRKRELVTVLAQKCVSTSRKFPSFVVTESTDRGQ